MFEFLKGKPNFEQDPIHTSIRAGLHKKGVLVSGDTGTGLTKVTEHLVQEISRNKLNTKIFISGYSFDDYKQLITKKKLKVFKIEEQNLDFNFTPVSLNSLNTEKIQSFVALVIQSLGIQKNALQSVMQEIEYFNYMDVDLLRSVLSRYPEFSVFNWNYIVRENKNGFNVFDGISEKLSQNDVVLVETDTFNIKPIAYALMDFVKRLHSSIIFVIESTQDVDEQVLKETYTQEAVIVVKNHPKPEEVNWFNMVCATKSLINNFDFIAKNDLQNYSLGTYALYIKEKNVCANAKWKLNP